MQLFVLYLIWGLQYRDSYNSISSSNFKFNNCESVEKREQLTEASHSQSAQHLKQN